MHQRADTRMSKVTQGIQSLAEHPTIGPTVALGLRHGEKILFLIVGGWNTLFGYFLWVVLQLLFYPQLSYR